MDLIEINAWKATDDEVFESYEEAKKYQSMLNFKMAFTEFSDKHFYSGMTGYDVMSIIENNYEEFKALVGRWLLNVK